MNIYRTHLFLTIVIILFAIGTSAIAEINIDPHGFGLSVAEGDVAEVEIEILNSFEFDVDFSVSSGLVNDEGMQVGPMRDDPGDLIDEFEPQQLGDVNRHVTGIAWDAENNWMWLSESDNARVMAVDPDDNYRMVGQVNMPEPVSGLGYYGGVFFGVGWRNHAWLFRVDAEGNNLGNFNLQGSAGAVDCGDDGRLYAMAQNVIYIYDIENDYQLLGRFDDYQRFLQNELAQSLCWVDEHPNGQLWLDSRTGNGDNRAWQVAVDTEEWTATELVQDFVTDAQNQEMGHPRDGIGHDGENLWITHWQSPRIRIIDDGVSEISILSFDPEEGQIAADELESIIITANAEGAEAGVYNFLLSIEFTEADQEEFFVIEISAVVSIVNPTFNISGTVSDPATGENIEDVVINLGQFVMTRQTNRDGRFIFSDLPPDEYEMTFLAPGYLPFTTQALVGDEGDLDLEIELLFADCEMDLEGVNEEIAIDESIQINFNATNNGTGPLTYTVDRRLLGDANADPWMLRTSHDVGVLLEDARIQGVVYANGRYYVSGAHDYNPAIYILNEDGEFIDLFIQPGDDRYGIKDMAWDGELIWGAIRDVIYGLTPDGEVAVSFESPHSPTSNIAYDSDRELLWVASTTAGITAIDREGNEVGEVDRQGMRIYGLAYYPDDPDGYQLYAFHKDNEIGDQIVDKIDIENDRSQRVSLLMPDAGGTAAGGFITNEYDVYSWVFMTTPNAGGEDRIDIWQIDARKDWMAVEPAEGMIDSEGSQEFVLTLDATDLPAVVFEGEVVIVHNGRGEEVSLPITLTVGGGGGDEERLLALHDGWNMVSLNVQPDPNGIPELTAGLVENDLLLLMKDGDGRFYSPAFGFCNIPGWNAADGYQMKMDGAAELILSGEPVNPDTPIQLGIGWSMISYFPRDPVDAILAFSGIVDALILAKDGDGRFYNPTFGFSNMGDMAEGFGYQVKVSEDVELVYTIEEENALAQVLHRTSPNLPVYQNTGSNMSVLVLADQSDGTEVRVYSHEELVGVGIVDNATCGIAVWGDDLTTDDVDGVLTGQQLTVKIGNNLPELVTLQGEGTYSTDGFWVVQLSNDTSLPVEFGIYPAYPNPFNNMTRLTFGLPGAADVSLAVYELNGRMVEQLVSGEFKAGFHAAVWDASYASTGVYMVRMESGIQSAAQKIVLVK